MIVARLPDGSWSAPSAIVTAGAGVGGQIGARLTDFVFVLNTKAAVDTFAQMGSVTWVLMYLLLRGHWVEVQKQQVQPLLVVYLKTKGFLLVYH